MINTVLGIDVGTQSVKAGLFDVGRGALCDVTARDYPGASLQNSQRVWNATAEAVRECLERRPDARALAVGISGQMHGTVLYDRRGEVLGDIINWQDERCNAPSRKFGGRTTIEEMNRRMGAEGFDDLGVDVMASGFFGATLFHIRELQPDLFRRVAQADLPGDFIRRRLTGGPSETDPTNAFSTGVFNSRRGEWHGEFIGRLDLPMEVFPVVRPTCEVVGKVTSGAASLTGLTAGTPVVTGGGDNQMSVIGTGIFSAGAPPLMNIGTSGQINLVIAAYRKVPGADTRPLLPGLFIFAGAGLTGGKSYTWLRDVVMGDIAGCGAALPDRKGLFKLLDESASRVAAGADGLRFEPYLRGTRRDPRRRGAFTGIGENNFSLGHRARAVMEGVVRELYDFYVLFGAGGHEAILGAGNGLVRSVVWPRIAADVFGIPLRVTDFENAVCGAALCAAAGCGVFRMKDFAVEYKNEVKPER